MLEILFLHSSMCNFQILITTEIYIYFSIKDAMNNLVETLLATGGTGTISTANVDLVTSQTSADSKTLLATQDAEIDIPASISGLARGWLI